MKRNFRNTERFVVLLLCLCFTLSLFSMPAEALNVSLNDRFVYEILFRLEAEGIVKSSLLSSLPLSRKEVARLTEEALSKSEEMTSTTRELVEILQRRFSDEGTDINYIKPVDFFYTRYTYSDTDELQPLNYNNDGDNYEKDGNLRAGFSSVAKLGHLSVNLSPELRYSDEDTDILLKEGYAALDILGIDVEFGKEAQWWGPGYHGSILLSNNAEAFTMLRITNQAPALLPWIFRYLGPFRFDFFVTRLESERAVSKPYLWGLRFDFKPLPYIELGLERTAMLGGEGRSEGLSTWWKSFTGKGENESGVEAGDQRAGFDIKLTLPFQWQPFQLYFEAAGEDEAGGLPSHWAYLGGLYLPGLFSIESVGLRVEYADTTVKGFNSDKAVWYTHHIYKSGYTYKGHIIGHHMGNDARDLFVQADYCLPMGKGRLYVSYDREKHDVRAQQEKTITEISAGIIYNIKDNLSIEAGFSTAKLDNYKVDDDSASLFTAAVTYRF